MTASSTNELLLAAFGSDICISDPEEIVRWSSDSWGLCAGMAAAVMRPRNVQEVSEIVRFCSAQGIAIVPQGGNTGLVGGAIPDPSGKQVILSLSRMDNVRELDPINYTITVDAGCILAHIQETAAEVNRLFPLSFGAEGCCQIGGVLSTNAGGNSVLRYGNTRDLVLGIEVVLADGTIWNGLRKLRKDNTGYDLKHLFIGAEGTLGIITAAVLKLFPKPRSNATAIVALSDLEAAPRLLALTRDITTDALSAFELIPRRLVELAAQHTDRANCVPPVEADWFVLIELTNSDMNEALTERLQTVLEAAHDSAHIIDASIAANLSQRDQMWSLRDEVAETQIKNGAVIYFDVSVPVSSVPAFIQQATAKLKELDPQIDINAFGHVGDGNIHFNLLQTHDQPADLFLIRKNEYERIVYNVVYELGGSFSAEHGIGSEKMDALINFKSPIELSLMKAVRAAISGTTFNPGKLIPSE
ncbi:FAD-binding oxidoreductase [Allopusillimonas ginsengisoli]|uniref:FAD-binding oxidoreductase n=1 Tax=Allopusillimonas ginsengisoli TaxID=453575 RepID=UPI001484ECD6